MKLKKECIPYDTGADSLPVPVGGAGRSALIRDNRTLGAIEE